MTKKRFADQLEALPAGPASTSCATPKGGVIYVGKAAILRSRVRSYFGSPHSMEPKTRALSRAIADFEYIVTNTAQEALHLEATLVKRHQPFFNVRLKDDKHYPYLRIDVQNPWPRVEITRRVENDGARYFGPYASAGSVRKTLDLVKKLFPWRACTKDDHRHATRAPAWTSSSTAASRPAPAYCTKEEYDEVIRAGHPLPGRPHGRTVVRALRAQMEEASTEHAVRARRHPPRPDPGDRERHGDAGDGLRPADGRGRLRAGAHPTARRECRCSSSAARR